MEIQWVPIEQLKPDPKNRNQHSKEQITRLAKLIQYQGWRWPIIVSKQDGLIKAGHGRLLAAQELGLKEVPVSYQDFTSAEQAYAFLTSDNAIASWAELDLSGINSDIGELGPDFDIDLLGLKDFELEIADKLEPGCDEDEVPEPKESICKLGDIWKLENHVLMCGDSTSIDAVEKLMSGEKADLVLTDPPYNIGSHSKNYVAQSSNHLRGDLSKSMKELSEVEWDKNFDIKNVLPNFLISSKEDCSYYIFTSQFLIGDIWEFFYNSNMRHVSYNIWFKPNPMPCLSKRHWTWSNEIAAYATRGKHTFNFPSEGHAFSVWTFTKKSDGSHPTQKPIELLEHILIHSSNSGHQVLDLFGGSGSTLIACEKTNRKCFMMELDPYYCDVIIARWEKYTGKKAELINGTT